MTQPWPFGDLAGFCLAVAQGRQRHEMIQCYGLDPAEAVTLTRAEAVERHRPDGRVSILRFGHLSGWGFVFEEGDVYTLDPAVQNRLSEGTIAATLSDVPEKAMTHLRLLRDGQLEAFQEIGSTIAGQGPRAEELSVELRNLFTQAGDRVQAGLGVLERLVSAHIVAGTLAAPLATLFVDTATRLRTPPPSVNTSELQRRLAGGSIQAHPLPRPEWR